MYESVDVAEKKYSTRRGAPELVLADAPNRPTFGGRGLDSNAVYAFEDEEEKTKTTSDTVISACPHPFFASGEAAVALKSRQVSWGCARAAAGKDALQPFGQPPAPHKAVAKPAHADAEPKVEAAAVAAEQHADKEPLNPELGSGNAPLGASWSDMKCLKPATFDPLWLSRMSVGESESLPVIPSIPERPPVVVSIVFVLKIALAVYLAFIALFTAWLRPSVSTLFWSILVGGGAGLGYSWLFLNTRHYKRLLNDGVRPAQPM